MSSRLVTSALMRKASSCSDWARSSCASASAGLERASDSDRPTSEVRGVRRSCDSAASRELRSRSDSMFTSAFCATSM